MTVERTPDTSTSTAGEEYVHPNGNGVPIRLRTFLQQNGISRDIYTLNRLGESIVQHGTPRQPFILYPNDQQKLKERIDEYRSNKAKGLKRPLDNGYVWTKDFFTSQKIPTYAIWYYHLTKGLAEKRGKSTLVTLSPEDQQTILSRWQQILNQREQKRSSSIPQLDKLSNLVVQISGLDPINFRERFLDQDPEVMIKASIVINSLTPIERDVVFIALSGIRDYKIAERVKTSVTKVRTIKQIAVERLTMMAENPQENPTGKPKIITITKDLQERFSFLATLAPNQMRTMFETFSSKLQTYPSELSWQKLAGGLGIDIENARTIIYLAYAQETPMSFGTFLQDERSDTIPKQKIGEIFKKVFELIMEHGNLLKVFIEAHEKNKAWISREEADMPSERSMKSNLRTKTKAK